MRKIRTLLLMGVILFNGVFSAGCWNYREVDRVAIVAGVAVDRGVKHKYRLTVEIVKIEGGRDTKNTPVLATVEGDSMLDAVRNEIAVTGKRLYWSHAKTIIISKEIAEEGVLEVIDWYDRDSETRADAHILISQGETAREVFESKSILGEIKSFELNDMLENAKSLSKTPKIEIWEFVNLLDGQGTEAIASAIHLAYEDGKAVPKIEGTAIFMKDRLIGFLDGEETKDLLFVQNKIKGGLLVVEEGKQTPITLEVFKNKTKTKVSEIGGDTQVKIDIETTATIDEIETARNYIDEPLRSRLEQDAGDMLKKRIEHLISKVKSEFNEDIFGFGDILYRTEPKVWKRVRGGWHESFVNLKTDVKAEVHIRNSAMLAKTLEKDE